MYVEFCDSEYHAWGHRLKMSYACLTCLIVILIYTDPKCVMLGHRVRKTSYQDSHREAIG